ncbi:MAG: GAF domain-containing protein [Planctomycetota bacterium]
MPSLDMVCLWSLAAILTLAPFALYRARHRFGSMPLWVWVGGTLMLGDIVSIAIPILHTRVALTSVALFPSLLSIALLLYIHSGVIETRRYILTLVCVSVAWSLTCALIYGALRGGRVDLFVAGPTGQYAELVLITPRTMVASAAAMLVDLFLLLIAWQWLQNNTRLPFGARAFLSLGLTLFADSTLFVFGAFWPADFVPSLYAGHLLGKGIAAAANALLVAAYVGFIEPRAKQPEARGTLDILRVKERLERVERALETSEQRYRQLFENILDAVVVIRQGRIFDMNRRAEALFGMTREDLKVASASELGLPAVTESFEVAKLRMKDGREVTVEAAGVSMDIEGAEARLITVRDISDRERAAALIRRKNRELEALNSVAELGIRNAALQDVMNEAVKLVQGLTGTDSVALCLSSEDGKSLTLAAATGMSDELKNKVGEIRFGLLWKVFQSGQALVENDLPGRSEARRDLMENGVVVHATSAAPIQSRGRTIGTLSACSYKPRTFAAEDAALLGTLGAQLGAVVDNARLIDAQRDQTEVSEILLAAATAFGRSRTVEDLADALLEAATLASGQPGVSLLIYDDERDLLKLTALAGMPDEAKKLLLGRTWGPKNEPTRQLREGRATLVLTREEMRKYDAAAVDVAAPAATVFVPLFQQEQFMGAIAVNFNDPLCIDGRTLSLLEGIAGLCAASLSNLNLWGIAERRANLGAALLSAGQALASARAPEQVTRDAAALARSTLRTEAAWVWTAAGGRFRSESRSGGLADLEGRVLEGNELFGGKLLDGGGAVALADSHAQDASAESRATARLLGARSALAVPLRVGERVLGAIAVGDAAPRQFVREDVTALETLATYTAVCLENARLLQDLSLSNEEIRDAQAQIVRAESLAAIGRLSAAIAHEVRNPLSGISAAAQALLKSVGQSGALASDVQLLNIIDRESKRLNRIITDFLQFARPRTPALRRVAVPALVDSTLGLLEKDMAGRFKVEREFSAELPAAHADGDQLKQVMLNLILNSMQAMPAGGTLSVRARPAELPAGPAVEISVQDTGPGIPSGDLPRVFEPFFSTKKEGTGLGLAIAHQIVQSHNGVITAHGSPSGGALIRVLLPASPSPAPVVQGMREA